MRRLVLVICLLLPIACGRPDSPPASTAHAPAAQASAPQARKASQAPEAPKTSPRVVFLGDSLTAGLGLAAEKSYPALIGRKIKDGGYDFEIVNAGVSGDTSAGGVRRLDWSLEGDVRVLVVALGANDGLRGLPVAELRKNLTAVLELARAKGITVILAGMEAPPNNGPEYTAAFRSVYSDLAREYNVRFIPFLLQGVAGVAALNQGDGIHPNVRGAEIVADLVWKELEPALRRQTQAGPKPQVPSPQ
jgi:acyl-CoA thioesterase-1